MYDNIDLVHQQHASINYICLKHPSQNNLKVPISFKNVTILNSIVFVLNANQNLMNK